MGPEYKPYKEEMSNILSILKLVKYKPTALHSPDQFVIHANVYEYNESKFIHYFGQTARVKKYNHAKDKVCNLFYL